MVPVASVVLASACSFRFTSYQDDHGSLGEAGTGPSSCVAYGCSLKNFLSFAHALFAPGIWFIVSVDLVLGSDCFLRLGLAVEYGKLDLTGDVYFRGCNAWSDSGYMLCNSTLVAMDELHTFSTLRQTPILKYCSPFSRRTEKRAQSMLLVAVLLCAVRTWKTGSVSTSFTWLRRVKRDSIFGARVSDTGAGSAGTTWESHSRLSGTRCQFDRRLLWTNTVTSVDMCLKQQQQQQQQQGSQQGSRLGMVSWAPLCLVPKNDRRD